MRLRRNKYGVSAKEDRTLDGIVFASKKEMTRYSELKLMEQAGAIEQLQLQPKWDIVVNGQKICSYVGDFFYVDSDGKAVVEDTKGMKTPAYRLKKKLMLAVHGIDIWES